MQNFINWLTEAKNAVVGLARWTVNWALHNMRTSFDRAMRSPQKLPEKVSWEGGGVIPSIKTFNSTDREFEDILNEARARMLATAEPFLEEAEKAGIREAIATKIDSLIDGIIERIIHCRATQRQFETNGTVGSVQPELDFLFDSTWLWWIKAIERTIQTATNTNGKR